LAWPLFFAILAIFCGYSILRLFFALFVPFRGYLFTFVTFCKKPSVVACTDPPDDARSDIGWQFLDHSSSSFRQRLQQLGQERTDP
jgi:hypothetical protein